MELLFPFGCIDRRSDIINNSSLLFMPHHTYLVRLGRISGEFGPAMVRIFGESQNAHGETKQA